RSLRDWSSDVCSSDLIQTIVAACSTLGITIWNTRQQSFEYFVLPSSALLKKPDLDGRILQISVDGRPIDNISTVSIQLYNKTSRSEERRVGKECRHRR